MHRRLVPLVTAALAAGLLAAACTQPSPPPTPTKAPAAAPTKAAEPAKAPATAPTQPPAPTAAPTAVPAKKVDWPEKGKTVTVIVPFAAGGAVDVGARILAAFLEKDLGVPFSIVNKAGATGQVGMTDLANSKPDGYTLAAPMLPSAVITYLDAERKATYDRKSFELVAGFTVEPTVLGVLADSPYKSTKDVLDAAKASPEKLKTGDSGLMAATHLAVLQLQKLAGVKFSQVHFTGAAPAVTALLGGHVDVVSTGNTNVNAQYKAGQVRILAIVDKEECVFVPGVKTLEAQGYKVYAPMGSGILAPAGTPKEIIDILSAAIKRAADSADLKKRLLDAGIEQRYMNPAQYADFWIQTEAEIKPLLAEIAKEK